MDEERRIKVMHNGTFDNFKRAKKNSYFRDIKGEYKGESLEEYYINNVQGNIEALRDYVECCRIYDCHKKKTKRLNKRVEDLLLNGPCLFITLTFTDEVLEKTSRDTRRLYVIRALKNISTNYVANIDYGKKNEREHYHALINCNEIKKEDMKEIWPYGFMSAIKARNNNIEEDHIRLSRYINKLSNHATKSTTKDNKLIYSRG